MKKISEDKISENPKKIWSAPVVEIISEGDIESGPTVNFIEGAATPTKGTSSPIS